jgi:DNA-binding NarL/FixJ family response regulator
MNVPIGSVLIAEDERTIGRHLAQLLTDAGYDVAGIVTRSDEVPSALEAHRADVLLLDIGLESETAGLELAESSAIPEETSLVFVSAKTDEATLARVQQIAPLGFVVKPFTNQQILAAVSVGMGHARDAPSASHEELSRHLELARDVLSRVARELERVGHLVGERAGTTRAIRDLPELASLSPREWDVLRGLIDHKRPPAIAKDLFISHHTVRNHLKSIFGKLGVHSQAELLERVLGPPEDEGSAP